LTRLVGWWRREPVLLQLVLYQPQELFYDATLVWIDVDPVDVSVRDREVVNDRICWERDGHSRLPILVASIKAMRVRSR